MDVTGEFTAKQYHLFPAMKQNLSSQQFKDFAGWKSCDTTAENMGHRLLFNGEYGSSSHCMTVASDVAGTACRSSGIPVELNVNCSDYA